MFRIDLLTIISNTGYTAIGIINKRSVRFVFRFFGHVDGVLYPVDDVEVVHSKGRIKQGLWCRDACLDLIERTSAHFDPVLHRFTVDHNRFQRVVIQIQVARATDRQIPLANLGILFRIVASCLERGAYAKNRQISVLGQCFIRINQSGDITLLRIGYDLNRRIVLHHREEAVHRRCGFTQLLIGVFNRCRMVGTGYCIYSRVCCNTGNGTRRRLGG
ncbi:hypothetical protein D3C73_1061440 [compost metagenome]